MVRANKTGKRCGNCEQEEGGGGGMKCSCLTADKLSLDSNRTEWSQIQSVIRSSDLVSELVESTIFFKTGRRCGIG